MDYECILGFKCPHCGVGAHTFVILPEPEGDELLIVDGAVIEVRCPHCSTRFRSRVWATPTSCRVEFINEPETVVDAGPPTQRSDDDEGWENYDPPPDPYSIFNVSLMEASVLLDEKGGSGSNLMNRMVFAHFIGAFEAFLADTLINEVLASADALKQLIERDERLRNRRFSLSEIAASPELIKDTVRARLRSEMWHNMKKASALYNIAFGIDVRGMLSEDNEIIAHAVDLRHDCVHRNGRDKDGNELTAFTKEYIKGIGGILSRTAHNIIKAFNERRAANFFSVEVSSAESDH
jgi:hypothetical protein